MGGIRGPLEGRCARGRPVGVLDKSDYSEYMGYFATDLCIHIDYDVVSSVRHCGWV